MFSLDHPIPQTLRCVQKEIPPSSAAHIPIFHIARDGRIIVSLLLNIKKHDSCVVVRSLVHPVVYSSVGKKTNLLANLLRRTHITVIYDPLLRRTHKRTYTHTSSCSRMDTHAARAGTSSLLMFSLSKYQLFSQERAPALGGITVWRTLNTRRVNFAS